MYRKFARLIFYVKSYFCENPGIGGSKNARIIGNFVNANARKVFSVDKQTVCKYTILHITGLMPGKN